MDELSLGELTFPQRKLTMNREDRVRERRLRMAANGLVLQHQAVFP
jgi:hypothetical protein